MIFNDHSKLAGTHAILSPSQSYWLRYSDDKMREVVRNKLAVERGTRLHALAAELIDLKQRLPKSKQTLNMYVNDAIGYRMQPEQVLYYSTCCHGTADAISFDESKRFLRIHDLKTGSTPAHMDQLVVYAALFCLEYDYKPSKIDTELRIYQSNEIVVHNPEVDYLEEVMRVIKTKSDIVTKILLEES